MHQDSKFYGTTTVGERGQVVIPSEVREKMGLDKGEKLLVFGVNDDMVLLTKASRLQVMANHLSQKLQGIQQALQESESEL